MIRLLISTVVVVVTACSTNHNHNSKSSKELPGPDSGIEVISSRMTHDLSGTKRIHVQYKNHTDKNISGVNFKWYPVDADSQALDGKVLGPKLTKVHLKNNEVIESSWEINENDSSSVLSVVPQAVSYEDGSTWVSSNDNLLYYN